jgi:addiction module RelE/StbE family toxin
MQVNFSRKFVKGYEKATQEIKQAFDKRLDLLRKNPFHPQLNNHPLTGKYSGYRSINVTGDWRAIFSISRIDEEEIITFEIIDTHSNLYR